MIAIQKVHFLNFSYLRGLVFREELLSLSLSFLSNYFAKNLRKLEKAREMAAITRKTLKKSAGEWCVRTENSRLRTESASKRPASVCLCLLCFLVAIRTATLRSGVERHHAIGAPLRLSVALKMGIVAVIRTIVEPLFPIVGVICPTVDVFQAIVDVIQPVVEVIFLIVDVFRPTVGPFCPTVDAYRPIVGVITPTVGVFRSIVGLKKTIAGV